MLLRSIDLFTGIGGITLGLAKVAEPVLYCENNEYVTSVLQRHIDEGDLPKAPIHDDVTREPEGGWPKVDLVCGGFPCQDISSLGGPVRLGLAGKRSGLFYDMMRVVQAAEAPYIFLENVGAITYGGPLSDVLVELRRLGFQARWTTFTCDRLGAPHVRNRWFCLARRVGAPPPPYMQGFTQLEDDWNQLGWDLDQVLGVPRAEQYMISARRDTHTRRQLGTLGNMACPKQVEVAWRVLEAETDDLHEERINIWQRVLPKNGTLLPSGDVRETDPPRLDAHVTKTVLRHTPAYSGRKRFRLVPTDAYYKRRKPTGRNIQRNFPLERRCIPTPRASATSSASFLCSRSSYDLATFMRFEQHTRCKQNNQINPHFVEWMMGLSKGWSTPPPGKVWPTFGRLTTPRWKPPKKKRRKKRQEVDETSQQE